MGGEIDLGIAGIGAASAVGRGGNAVVYRARELDHDRWVAVKVLRGLGSEADLRRFDRERRAMGRLSELSGIVAIYSSGITQNGEPYLVMPLLPRSLEDDLDENGPKDWAEAAAVMATVARTIGAAHQANVIHRDLKPSNILLTSAGVPLVADFGIASLTDSTASSAITLTPSYSPPEVLRGASPSEAADVYALGATLFALISGSAPFVAADDESMFSVMQRINDQPVDDLRHIKTPDPIWAVVERSMRKAPNDRFSSAADFADALEQAVAKARNDRTPAHDRLKSSNGTEPGRHAGAASTVIVKPPVTHATPKDAQQPSGHRKSTALITIGLVALLVFAAAVAVVRTGDAGDGTAVDSIAVGSFPQTPIAAGGLIWVSNSDSGSVSVIDPATRTVVDTVDVGSSPVTPIEANGLIWVSNFAGQTFSDSNSVSVIDPATRAVVDTVDVGSRPVTPIEADGLIWVPNYDGASVSVIDVATRVVVETIDVGTNPGTPIAVDGLIWVPHFLNDSVSVIDVATRVVVDTIDVGTNPGTPIAVDGLIWVPNYSDDSVSVIDAATRVVVDTVDVGNSPQVPIAADGLIWVATTNDDSIWVIDAATRVVVDTVDVGNSPQGQIAVGGFIWVPNSGDGSISVIDAATRVVVDTITVGTNPGMPIAVGGFIWVPNSGDGSISVIERNA